MPHSFVERNSGDPNVGQVNTSNFHILVFIFHFGMQRQFLQNILLEFLKFKAEIELKGQEEKNKAKSNSFKISIFAR